MGEIVYLFLILGRLAEALIITAGVGLTGSVILDAVNSEGSAELASPRMTNGLSAIHLGWVDGGVDVSWSFAWPVRTAECVIGNNFAWGSGEFTAFSFRESIYAEYRYFPFHKLPKGYYLGGIVSVNLASGTNGTWFYPEIGAKVGYRIDFSSTYWTIETSFHMPAFVSDPFPYFSAGIYITGYL